MGAIKWVGGDAGGTTDWNIDANWSGAAKPTSSDDVTFDATSDGYACTLTAAGVCKSLTITSGYTKAFSTGGQTLTSVGTISFDGTGNLTLSAAVTITGDGNFHIDVNVGTIAMTSCNLDIQGTGNITVDKNSYINNLTWAYSGKTSTNNGSAYLIVQGVMTVNGGALTTNQASDIKLRIAQTTQTDPIVLVAGYTWNGSAGMAIYLAGVSQTFNIPAMTYTGSGRLRIYSEEGSGTNTVNMTGAINWSSVLEIYNDKAPAYVFVFNTNNYAITCVGMYVGNNYTGTATYNWGSSVITNTSYQSIYTGAGTTNYNMQTSQWTVSGLWTFDSNWTVDPGTSIVNFTPSASRIVTSNGKSFYTVNLLTASGNSITLGDALSCHDLTTSGSVAFSSSTYSITSTSTVSFSHTGTLTLANVTITGNGDFTIASGVGTCTISSGNLYLQGTGNLDLSKSRAMFATITCGYTGKTTTCTACAMSAGARQLILGVPGAAGTFALPSYGTFYVQPTSTSTSLVLNTGYVITGNNGSLVLSAGICAADTVITLPAISITSGTISFRGNGSDYENFTNVTYNMAGDISCTTMLLSDWWFAAPCATWTFNTNNYTMTIYNMTLGTVGSGNSVVFTVNFGSSIVNITNVFATVYGVPSTIVINLQTSVWNITYDTTFGSNLTVNAGTSVINFIGSYGATFNTGGYTFYDIVLNLSSNSPSLILGANLLCHTIVTTTGAHGNWNSNTYSITSSSSITFNSTGTLTLAAVTITSNGDFIIDSGVGACTLTSCSLEMRGTGNFDIDKTGLTFVSVKFNADGKVISSTGAAVWTTGRLYVEPGTKVKYKNGITPVVTTYVAGDCDGSLGKLVEFESTSPGNRFGITLPATM